MFLHIQQTKVKQRNIVIGGVLLSLMLILSTYQVYAQSESGANTQQIQDGPLSSTVTNKSELNVSSGQQASCFDYYDFGSVNLNLRKFKTSYKAGEPVTLSGSVENTNAYPLTDVNVYARIFKTYDNATPQANTILVDEFILKEGLTIGGNQTQQIKGAWTVPLSATKGTYRMQLYVADHQRFNMSGLVFTEDIYAQRISFEVDSNKTREGVYIDRGRISVNDKKHDTVGFITKHDANKPVTVTFPLVNDSESKKQVTLRNNIYQWDTLQEKNKLKSQTEEITLNPGQSKELAYTVDSPQKPVYVMDISAFVDDAYVSGTKVRFAINNKGRPRINAAGVTSMPVDNEDTMFVCLHNTNQGVTPLTANATLKAKESGETLSKITVNGKISSAIQGFTNTIQTDKSVKNATLNVALNSQGETVDKITINYSCEELSGVTCPSDSETQRLTSNLLWGGLGVVVVIIVGGSLGIYAYQRQKE